jgi:thiol-disulfide isomerase/thioredoxin
VSARSLVAMLALACACGANAAPAEPQPLDAKGLQQLRAAQAGKPYVLSLWSVHCAPCAEEMAMLREMRAKHPGVEIVLVAADAPSEREAIVRYLAKHDPGPAKLYRYADDFEERMRYAVDPRWRGELPRSYFVDAAGMVQSKTGVPEREWVETWFNQQRGQTR